MAWLPPAQCLPLPQGRSPKAAPPRPLPQGGGQKGPKELPGFFWGGGRRPRKPPLDSPRPQAPTPFRPTQNLLTRLNFHSASPEKPPGLLCGFLKCGSMRKPLSPHSQVGGHGGAKAAKPPMTVPFALFPCESLRMRTNLLRIHTTSVSLHSLVRHTFSSGQPAGASSTFTV